MKSNVAATPPRRVLLAPLQLKAPGAARPAPHAGDAAVKLSSSAGDGDVHCRLRLSSEACGTVGERLFGEVRCRAR